MNPLIENNITRIEQLCIQYDVDTMYAFGSVCADNFDSSSDVDILISFKPIHFSKYSDNYFELKEALEKLFQRKVDLITTNSLSNPFFISQVENSKRLLYAA